MKRKWLRAEIAVCVSKVQKDAKVCEPKHSISRVAVFPICVKTRRYTIAGEVYLLASPFISMAVAKLVP